MIRTFEIANKTAVDAIVKAKTAEGCEARAVPTEHGWLIEYEKPNALIKANRENRGRKIR